MQAFAPVVAPQFLLHLQNVAHEFVVGLARCHFRGVAVLLDRTKRFHDQNRMVRHDRAPAFTHDRRMRHAFRVAHVHDVPDDIVGVFLEGVVRRAIEARARAVVIHAQSAAHIQITQFVAEFGELRVIARRFPHRALDRGNIRHLRADMEVDQLEAMGQPFGFQEFARGYQVRGVEAELRVLSATRGPLPGTFAMQPHANPDVRLHPHLPRHPDRLLQFLDLLDHDDDRLAQPPPEHGGADVSAIFVAVANDQALQILVHGQGRDQLRLRPRLEAEMILLSRVHDLLDHLAQLIDLDREDTAVMIAIAEFANRTLESEIDGSHAVAQQILKANHERKTETALPCLVHHFEDIDRSPAIAQRPHLGVASSVDRKIPRAPALDIVGRDGGFNIPLGLWFFGRGGQRMRIFNERGEHASRSSVIPTAVEESHASPWA